MMQLFNEVSQQCSRYTTERYSTSFSSAIRLLHKDLQSPIHNIYGFVRFADEIVDTFHDFDKALLLAEFKKETYQAIDRGISLNPLLNSFQLTVNKYRIKRDLIEAFFKSMEEDLEKKQHDESSYVEYIYGSAEVVGLMCLCVFCNGDNEQYDKLKSYARSLGAAFQKVNFLRDMKADFSQLNRVYFPGFNVSRFANNEKEAIEAEIQHDFDVAREGIPLLPAKARFGVYVAYKYYLSLFRKIKKVPPKSMLESRIRIPDYGKMLILAKAGIRNQLNLL